MIVYAASSTWNLLLLHLKLQNLDSVDSHPCYRSSYFAIIVSFFNGANNSDFVAYFVFCFKFFVCNSLLLLLLKKNFF